MKTLITQDRPWREYLMGTKAHAFNGGYWERVPTGWKWFTGSTFPTPGGDAIGKCIELPDEKKSLIYINPAKMNRKTFRAYRAGRYLLSAWYARQHGVRFWDWFDNRRII